MAFEAPGENAEPSTTPAIGVMVPDALGEDAGRELVDAKRVDNEALERRYGSVKDDKGDFNAVRRVLGRDKEESGSEDCGDCRG